LAAYGLFADGVAGAEVIVVASDARQAGITHRQVARMVELEPRLAEQEQVFQNRIYVPHTDSTLTVLPAEPGALQGWNPSLAIVEDELHVVTRPVRDAAALAAGKRDRALSVDQHTIEGRLAGERVGREWRVSRASVEARLGGCRVNADPYGP
jgi:phage terminase large subunit-like protein